jgi:hypothetical protein
MGASCLNRLFALCGARVEIHRAGRNGKSEVMTRGSPVALTADIAITASGQLVPRNIQHHAEKPYPVLVSQVEAGRDRRLPALFHDGSPAFQPHQDVAFRPPHPRGIGARKPRPSPAAGQPPPHLGPPSPAQARPSLLARALSPMVAMGGCPCHRQASNRRPLAPGWLPPFLALGWKSRRRTPAQDDVSQETKALIR